MPILPLLNDLEEACDILLKKGLEVRVTIFPVNYHAIELSAFRHLEFYPCPSHKELPAFLKGADVLFLPERFDETVGDIRLCVSSKAHLFMFSERPIIVYTDISTGLAQYAIQEGWGEVVAERDPMVLAFTLANLFGDGAKRQVLVLRGQQTIAKYHDLNKIRDNFEDQMLRALRKI